MENKTLHKPFTYWEPIDNPVVLGFATFVMCLIMFAVVFGNSLVITAFFRTRSLRTPSNVYLVSLAFVDLSFGVLMLPLNIYNTVLGRWGFGKGMCKFWVSFNVTVTSASIFHICLIALDRYRSVTQGVDYIMHRKPKDVILSIIFVMLLAFGLSTPPLVGLFPKWLEEFDVERGCHLCIDPLYVLSSCFVTFAVPTVLLVYWYYKIFLGIRDRLRGNNGTKMKGRKRKTMEDRGENSTSLAYSDGESRTGEERTFATSASVDADQVDEGADEPPRSRRKSFSNSMKHFFAEKQKISAKRERRAATTLAVIIVAFSLCWLPLTCAYIAMPFLEPSQYPNSHVNMLTGWLGYSNSAINPIIYTIFNLEFRKAFIRILTCERIRRNCI